MFCQERPEGSWEHGEWELGKRLVTEEEGGEEVAVREVRISFNFIQNYFDN